MDKFANKGLESKGSDAEIPRRRFGKTPSTVAFEEYSIRRLKDLELYGFDADNPKSGMVVEGYDTSPDSRREDVEEALRKHFASRRIKLIHASVPLADEGGRTLCRDEIAPYPFDDNRLEHVFAPTKARDKLLPRRMLKVTGFDTSLAKDDDDIEKMFRVVFPRSTCSVFSEDKAGLLCLGGQDAIDKAMKLSGVSVEGFKFAVDAVVPLRKMPGGLSRERMLALAARDRAKQILGK